MGFLKALLMVALFIASMILGYITCMELISFNPAWLPVMAVVYGGIMECVEELLL